MDRASKQNFHFEGKGGALDAKAPSYVERQADKILYEKIMKGQFCYVFAPRQMGKSSLNVQVKKRLEEQETGIQPIIIDLSAYGTTDISADQWYRSLMTEIYKDLRNSIESSEKKSVSQIPKDFMKDRDGLTRTDQFRTFLEDVALKSTNKKIVIFLDEVDAALRLPFADDFFSVIRAIFNARSYNDVLKRLVFVLFGVVTTSQLIQEPNQVYNIGEKIDLREFTWRETKLLRQGMDKFYPGQGDAILFRVMYWTRGHPYLTQNLCQAITENAASNKHRIWTDKDIDDLVDDLFLSAGIRNEINLSTVRKVVAQDRDLLSLYHQIRQELKVRNDESSEIQNRLKLYGLVHTEMGILKCRNEIYWWVFDLDWIQTELSQLSKKQPSTRNDPTQLAHQPLVGEPHSENDLSPSSQSSQLSRQDPTSVLVIDVNPPPSIPKIDYSVILISLILIGVIGAGVGVNQILDNLFGIQILNTKGVSITLLLLYFVYYSWFYYGHLHKQLGKVSKWVIAHKYIVLFSIPVTLIFFASLIPFQIKALLSNIPSSVKLVVFVGLLLAYFIYVGWAYYFYPEQKGSLTWKETKATSLYKKLNQAYGIQGDEILYRIYHWTNGLTDLTGALSKKFVNDINSDWSDRNIDRFVEEQLNSIEASDISKDFERNVADDTELLDLYHQVRAGKKVAYKQEEDKHNRLIHSSLVHVENGILRWRSEIHWWVFDLDWIAKLVRPSS